VDKLLALGIISVLDLEEVGADPLVEELQIDPELAKKVVAAAKEKARSIAAEKQKKQAEDIMEQEQAETKENPETEQ
jgi:N utilization substance protein A